MSRRNRRHGHRVSRFLAEDRALNSRIDSIMSEVPEFMPDFSLDRQVAQARRDMGEARWAELNAEWGAPEKAVL